MEIRIKTAEEFRDAHVTVEVNGARLYTAAQVGDAQASEAELVAAPLRRRIAELEAENAWMAADHELVSAPLLAALAERADRIAELKGEIRRTDHQISAQTERAGQLDQRNAQLTAELARERDRNAELVEQLARAGEINERNAELVGELARQRKRRVRDLELVERQRDDHAADLSVAKRKLDKAQHTIETLSAQLGRISGAVHSPEVVSALRRVYETWEPRIMGEAIRQVRDALGSPSLPEAASEPTSQA